MMNRINVNEHNFTTTEIEALTTCHNEFFYAMMADRMADQEREERMALRKLQQTIPNVVEFHPNFDGEDDVVVLANN